MVGFVGSSHLNTCRCKFYGRIEKVIPLNPYLIYEWFLPRRPNSEAMFSNGLIVGDSIIDIGCQLNRAFPERETKVVKPVVADGPP